MQGNIFQSVDRYFCTECKQSEEIKSAKWKCDCGGLLLIQKGHLDFQQTAQNKYPGLWKFEPLISSFKNLQPISIGEGNTPISQAQWGTKKIHLKWEGMMPTGSYKDRGATAMISALYHLGVQSIVEDSSGNAGAAIAWYAKMAGISCVIYVPENASGGKLNTIMASGAKLVTVAGERENASKEALKASLNTFYASHVWCPFFIEGVKSLAFELEEPINKGHIERIILPLGNGALLLGLFKGLEELLLGERISQLPELIAVQSGNCAPIYNEFHGIQLVTDDRQSTIAKGIANRNPPRKKEIVSAIKKCNGTILQVKEEEIKDALFNALSRGWMIEPTSAVALAGLNYLADDIRTLVIISGSGLKINEQLAGLINKRNSN